MKRFIFSYGIRFQENGRVETFPALEIFLLGRRNRGIRVLLHIDSGATTSILPKSDAEVLGIDFKAGKKMLVRGVFGESLTGRRHLIRIQFNQLKIKIPVIFVEDIFVPRILGREGIFPQFGILFDEFKKRTVFLPSDEERNVINSLFE
jgi:hypothetical protein